MAACKILVLTSISSVASTLRSGRRTFLSSPHNSPTLCFSPPISSHQGLRVAQNRVPQDLTLSIELVDSPEELLSTNHSSEPPENPTQDNVEHLLTHKDDAVLLMKMERGRSDVDQRQEERAGRWFRFLDRFKCGDAYLSSGQIVEALEPHIMKSRMERFRNVAMNRSYSVCLVVEGLSNFGNVSAAFLSADALGFQSVHVVSCDSSKRYRENRHDSMGAEKWLDIELWDSIQDCFKALKSRGY